MNELSKRVAKYYSKQGFKLFLYVIFFMITVAIAWGLVLFGDDYDWKRKLLSMLLGYYEWIVPYLIFYYSIYAPTWHDGVAMSMGVRRKDVFCGNLIKLGTYALCNALSECLLILLSNQTEQMNRALFLMAISLAAGSLGHFMGYKVYRYGKTFMIFSAIVFIVAYFVIRVSYAINHYGMANNFLYERYIFVYILGSIILFGVMEMLIYKANKKSVVIM